jgi:peptidyl-tRNA hydrolase
MTDTTHTLISSRSEFHDAIRQALADIAAEGCREVFLSDGNFTDWPLSDASVLASLTAWARSQRRLTLLAQQFDEMARRHARWVEWRRQWSHLVECRANTELEAGQVPTLLLAPGLLVVRLVDPVRYRGSVSRVAADLVHSREVLDAVLQRSESTFPATTLGL